MLGKLDYFMLLYVHSSNVFVFRLFLCSCGAGESKGLNLVLRGSGPISLTQSCDRHSTHGPGAGILPGNLTHFLGIQEFCQEERLSPQLLVFLSW